VKWIRWTCSAPNRRSTLNTGLGWPRSWLVIFPAVFNNGLDPAAGAGLIFQTLPVAFAQMPGGHLFGILFFLMLSVAGITSMVGLVETVTHWVEERYQTPRHGSAQVFVMSSSGGAPKRVTYKGDHNQTPAWCPDAKNPLIAFTGREGGTFDVFTVNIKTGRYTRLTQGQGLNKDPAFSPDCRMVAFASSRGGIFISNPEGLNQTLVVRGGAETVRWSR